MTLRFQKQSLRGPALFLAAVPLLGLGCGSKETAPAPSSSSTAPPAAPATQAPSADPTAAAAAANADLDKREMSPFKLDETTGEFGKPKDPPADAPVYQKMFRQLAGGKQGYCGVHTSGNIVCWGATPADGMGGAFVQVAVADKFLCGMESGGGLKCSPDSGAPTLTAPAASASASAAPSTSAAPSAAVTGDPTAAPSESATAAPAAPAPVKYRSIAAGPNHVCALDKDNHATCWGGEGACALPAAPEDAKLWTLSVGTCHVCARDTNGGVHCWAPPGTAAATPPAGLNSKELASGDGFTCAVDTKQALVCWGSAPAAPADAPKEIESIGARGGTLCVVAKGGALRCWGTQNVTQPGPFTQVTVANESVCAAVSKDKLQCFGKAGDAQLTVPEDSSMLTVLDAGRTPDEMAANKKRRADTFRELVGKLQERDLPLEVGRGSKIPVGRVVEEQYLPVLDLVNFNRFFPASHYHYGFALKTPDKKYRLLVMHDDKTPKLMSFGADGKRLGQLPLASYALTRPDPVLFDCGDVYEEVVMETSIGADFKITAKTTTVLESLGRLKNKEGKVQNFCKVRQMTDEYAVSPTGTIDKVRSKSEVLHDKIADEACRGKWMTSPRSEDNYKASPDLPEVCQHRLKK